MKPPADGWDREEQETLALVENELAAFRARQAELSEHDEARLLRRIHTEAGHQRPARGSIFWTRPWFLAAASVVIVAGVTFMLRDRGSIVPSATPPAPEQTIAKATPRPAPAFLLALDKPDLKVSPGALTYRSSAGENPMLADLKPAFDAFRASDYALQIANSRQRRRGIRSRSRSFSIKASPGCFCRTPRAPSRA
jgi:hypothetical protein